MCCRDSDAAAREHKRADKLTREAKEREDELWNSPQEKIKRFMKPLSDYVIENAWKRDIFGWKLKEHGPFKHEFRVNMLPLRGEMLMVQYDCFKYWSTRDMIFRLNEIDRLLEFLDELKADIEFSEHQTEPFIRPALTKQNIKKMAQTTVDDAVAQGQGFSTAEHREMLRTGTKVEPIV